MKEMYTVTIVIQTAGGTYTKTLLFDTQDMAEKVKANIATIIDETWGD